LDTGEQNITITSLFDRDTILHLRVPFSFFLMPVFIFGISQAPAIHLLNTTLIFIAMHLLIYPGSNVYNSYMDKDTGSIGGLKNPPPVTKKLYYASIVFDTAGLLLCCAAGWQNALVAAGYIAFSKSYSWQGIRVKKYTYLSWLSVMFFQGGYTFMLASMATQNRFGAGWFTNKNLECMLIASLLIGGSYPLTQIYQHDEDSSRGDYTLSYRLGINGTFMFTAVLFLLGSLVVLHYFLTYYSVKQFLIFTASLTPVIVYFAYWFMKSMENKAYADYTHSMLMNKVSSFCMTVCFTIITFLNY
jgi:1,4-dihydroxy-2-naphthoate octaprenyltransferase